MKKATLFFVLFLTGCQTAPLDMKDTPFQVALARQSEQKIEMNKSNIKLLPMVKEVEDTPVDPKINIQEKTALLKIQPQEKHVSEKELPLSQSQTDDRIFVLRFPKLKDSLTPFEEERFKAFILKHKSANKIIIQLGSDENRKGYEILVAMQERARHIKNFFSVKTDVSEVFSPEIEENTVIVQVF